jgi:hypothetical protein
MRRQTMAFTQEKTLVYEKHTEEMEVLARVIDLLGKRDTTRALEVAMARHAALLEAQKPRLKDYDPREELRKLQS